MAHGMQNSSKMLCWLLSTIASTCLDSLVQRLFALVLLMAPLEITVCKISVLLFRCISVIVGCVWMCLCIFVLFFVLELRASCASNSKVHRKRAKCSSKILPSLADYLHAHLSLHVVGL